MLLSPVLLGAQCNPTAPACSVTRAGEELGSCEGYCMWPCIGVPACLRQCVASVPEGGACDPDPCIPSPLLCGPGLLCLPSEVPPGSGTVCQPPEAAGYLFCRPGDATARCGTGLVCRGFDDAPAPYACPGNPRPLGAPADRHGTCGFPIREGGECDSDWGEAPGCAQCEPGTECLPDPGGVKRCFRRCTTADDCPCTGTPPLFDRCIDRSPGQDGSDRRCENCAPHGEQCETEATVPRPCCDAGDSCFCNSGSEPGACISTRCCRPTGSPCTPGEMTCCFSTGVCAGTPPVCHVCSPAGAPPDPFASCCAPAQPSDDPRWRGLCAIPCEDGVTCTVTACPNGPPGRRVCDPSGGTCVTDTSPEVCNGIDDDCNGLVDDGVDTSLRRMPCTDGEVLADPANMFPGCGSERYPGRRRCIDGEERCISRRDLDYCATNSSGVPYSNNGACFSGPGACHPDILGQCYASETCQGPDCMSPTGFCCLPNPMCTGAMCWETGRRTDDSCP